MIRISKYLKQILLLITLLFLTEIANSQVLIPRFGLTLAKTSRNSADIDVKFKQGFLIGLGYELPLTDVFCVQAELTYLQKGQKTAQELYEITDNRNYSLSFLEVPILIKATLGKGRMKFCPHVGVSVSYGLGGKVNYLIILENPNTGELERYTDEFNIKFKKNDPHLTDNLYIGSPIDVGLQAGLGFLLFDKVIVDVRYSLGLKGYEFFNNEFDKNRVLQFCVGVPIKLKLTKSK